MSSPELGQEPLAHSDLPPSVHTEVLGSVPSKKVVNETQDSSTLEALPCYENEVPSDPNSSVLGTHVDSAVPNIDRATPVDVQSVNPKTTIVGNEEMVVASLRPKKRASRILKRKL